MARVGCQNDREQGAKAVPRKKALERRNEKDRQMHRPRNLRFIGYMGEGRITSLILGGIREA